MPDIIKRNLAALTGGLLLIALIANGFTAFKLYSARETITVLTAANERLAGDLSTCRSNTVQLEGALEGQNKAVESLQRTADTALAIANAEQGRAEDRAKLHDYDAQGLANLPPLPAGANACEAASELITTTIGRRTK